MTAPSRLAVVDCPTGLAGNMLLAALFDLGLPEAAVHEPLAALGLAQAYRLQLRDTRSAGLRGLQLEVELTEPSPSHRHWGDLQQQLAAAPLNPELKQRVLAVFALLAEAEGAVHGHGPEQVHFHEVGAVDALVDVVGVCAGLQHFGIRELICTPPPAGHGRVSTAHGLLPLPAPAVLELARRRSVPLASSEGFPPAELTTPTGLALMAALADRFAPSPALVPEAVGVGLGTRVLDRSNLLRIVLAPAAAADSGERLEPLLQQQAQIDDACAEDLAFLMDALRQAGALEVFAQPLLMKKGRPASLITVLARPDQAAALRRVWWLQGSSIGVREQLQQRWSLPREQSQIATPWGPVRIKRSRRPDGSWLSKPEADDLAQLAQRHQLPIASLRRAVLALLDDGVNGSPVQPPEPRP
ncbi:MAG: nickel pincer cofactor biosynthesis protein LarC [Cyanobacteria bacterium M_surface_10_m2_179]|nr:nickel pincer cofactor biosynthesis protein LarC [Cyanobacteria bacterium M_surface_10_m2_179]